MNGRAHTHDWKRFADGRMVCRSCHVRVAGEWAEGAYRAAVRDAWRAEVAARAEGHAGIITEPVQASLSDERCVDCGASIPGVKVPTEHPELTGSFVCERCARAQGLPSWGDLMRGGAA